MENKVSNNRKRSIYFVYKKAIGDNSKFLLYVASEIKKNQEPKKIRKIQNDYFKKKIKSYLFTAEYSVFDKSTIKVVHLRNDQTIFQSADIEVLESTHNIFIFNLKNKGKIPKKSFMIITLYILLNNNDVQFTDLINYFRKPDFSIITPEKIKELFNHIQFFYKKDQIQYLKILNLIGLFREKINPKEINQDIMKKISNEILQNSKNIYNNECKLGICAVIESQFCSNNQKITHFLDLIDSNKKISVLTKIIEKNLKNQKSIQTLMNIIFKSHKSEITEYLTSFMEYCEPNNIVEISSILSSFSKNYFPKDEFSKLLQDGFLKYLNKTNESFEAVKSLIEILQKFESKNIFMLNIRDNIKNCIQNFGELTQDYFEFFLRILENKNSGNIAQYLPLDQYFPIALNKKFIGFKELFEFIKRFDNENLKNYIEINVSIKYKENNKDALFYLENEINQIRLENDPKYFVKEIVRQYLILVKNDNVKFEDILQIIENSKNQIIKDEFIEEILLKKKEKYSSSNGISIYICKVMKKFRNKNSYIYINLINKLTCLRNPKYFDNKEERKKFINEPSLENPWFYVLQNYKIVDDNLISVVCSCFLGIYYDIIEGSITLQELQRFNNLTNKDILKEYLIKIFRIKNLSAEFNDMFENNIKKYESIIKSIEIIENFMQIFILDKTSDSEAVYNCFNILKYSLSTYILNKFRFTGQLDKINKFLIKYCDLVNSQFFHSLIGKEFENLSIDTSKLIDDFDQICNNLINYFKPLLLGKFSVITIIEFQMKTAIHSDLYPNFEFFRNHLKIKENYLFEIKELTKLASLPIKEFCNYLIESKEIIRLNDEKIVNDCLKYIKMLSEIYTMKCDEFLKLTQPLMITLDFENIGEYSIKIFYHLTSSKNLIDFCESLTENDINNMKELIQDYDYCVSLKDIEDFTTFYHFFIKINKKSYHEIIQIIKENDNPNELAEIIKRCNLQVMTIKIIYKENLNKNAAKRKQIIQIISSSQVEIDSKFEFKLEYEITQGNTTINKIIKLKDLIELKERALLISNTSDEEDIQINNFIEFVNCIMSIQEIETVLLASGYQKEKDFKKSFKCTDNNFEDLIKFKNYLENLSKEWESSIHSLYSNYPLMLNFHSKHFWIIEEFFVDKNQKKSKIAKNLIHFAGKKSPKKVSGYSKSEDIQTRFFSLGESLSNLETAEETEVNEKLLDLKLEQKLILDPNYIYFIESENIVKGIFTLFLSSNLGFPSLQQIQFCYSNTTVSEIKSFLYRCFKDSNSKLFLVVNCDNLLDKVQFEFINWFIRIYEQNNSDYRLAFIAKDKKCKIVEFFQSHRYIKFITIHNSKFIKTEDIKKIVEIIDPETLLVTSAEVGLGKTFFIEEQAKKEGRILNEILISGEISLVELIKKMNRFPEDLPSYLYISIHETVNYYLVNEFIMTLSLFKAIKIDTKLYLIPETTRIVIEVSNSLNNKLFKQLTYLENLRNHHISNFDLSALSLSENLTSEINYVCNYLSLFKENELDTKEIKFSELLNISIIPNEEKLKLISNINQLQNVKIDNFIILDIFIRILCESLKNFENSGFFTINSLSFSISNANKKLSQHLIEIKHLRTAIFSALLTTTEEFTTRSISQVGPSQAEPNSELENFNETTYLTFESSNHFIITFNINGDAQFIYRFKEKVPIELQKLITIQANPNQDFSEIENMIRSNQYEIDDYTKIDHSTLLEKLKNHLKNAPIDASSDPSYVITPDNFLKMNLIELRARCKIPIIIMGGAGVGKTNLINYLVKIILKENLEIFPIHEGITSQKIILKIESIIKKNSTERTWILFDGFNTNMNVGLICSIICARKLNGVLIPENFIFVGICNSYRKKTENLLDNENIGIKLKTKTYLTESPIYYNLKQLPETATQYVWDFGSLGGNDLRRYIKSMIEEISTNHSKVFQDLLCFAHEKLSGSEVNYSTSLRDVSRFIRLYKWFKNSRCTRKQLKKSKRYLENVSNFQLSTEFENSDEDLAYGVLAFCHCYYLRIPSNDKRKEFLTEVSRRSNRLLSPELILSIIQAECHDYFARMELEEGIAINQALSENIFTLIPCIYERIPVLICGKPGCSKSLSISLLFSNLKGERSNDPYFSTIPELIQISYQGSYSSTSEDILNIFKKEESMKIDSDKFIPVIVFDEIGLAQLSPYNPLKVLPILLKNKKISFIALSNWRLDVSSMDKVLLLVRPDPDYSELFLTAKSIFQSIFTNNEMFKFDFLIKAVTASYENLKNLKLENFYGLRDFFNLIKYISIQIKISKNFYKENLFKIAIHGIQRNFGGNSALKKNMIENFVENYKPKSKDFTNHDSIFLITENICDSNSRYLMIISNLEAGSYILNTKMKEKLIDYSFCVSSSFKYDRTDQDYKSRTLIHLIHNMEVGQKVILLNHEQIYSNLFELFNQSFNLQANRKYCRINLGDYFNPRCFVSTEFKVIIFLDENQVDECDPPFLNRFEKHYIDLQDYLSQDELEISATLVKWVYNVSRIKNIDATSLLFPLVSETYLKLLVASKYHSKTCNKDEFIQTCKFELIKRSPSDILVFINIEGFDETEKQFIINSWKKSHHGNFQNYLEEKLSLNSNQVLIVTTFQVNFGFKIFSVCFDNLITFCEIDKFRDEKEFDKECIKFQNDNNKRILIIYINYDLNREHICFVKFKLEKLVKDIGKNEISKIYCLIIAQSRSKKNLKGMNDSFVIPISDWDSVMIDSINSLEAPFSDEILGKSTKELLIEHGLPSFEENIWSLVEGSLYTFNPRNQTDLFYTQISFIIKALKNKKEAIVSTLWKILCLYFNDEKIQLGDWKKEAISNNYIIEHSESISHAISNVIKKELEKGLTQIFYILEKNHALESYFYAFEKNYEKPFQNLWTKKLESLCCNILNIRLQNSQGSNVIDKYPFELNFPFSFLEYQNINKIYKQSLQYDQPQNINKETFSQKFSKISLLEDLRDKNLLDDEIKKIYRTDLIKLHLKTNNLDFTYIEVINQIVIKSFKENDLDFVLNLFENTKKIELILYCFKIVSKSFSSANQTFIEYLLKIINKDNTENLNFIELIIFIIKELIDMLIRYFMLITESTLKSTSEILKGFYSLVFQLRLISNKSISNFVLFEFIFKLSLHAINIKMPCNEIVNLVEKASSGNQIFSKPFMEYLLGISNRYLKNNEKSTEIFQVYYLELLINNNLVVLPDVLKYIEDSIIGIYSKPLLKMITSYLGLEFIVDDKIKECIQVTTIDFQNRIFNSVMEFLEIKGLNSKFAVLLGDCIEDNLYAKSTTTLRNTNRVYKIKSIESSLICYFPAIFQKEKNSLYKLIYLIKCKISIKLLLKEMVSESNDLQFNRIIDLLMNNMPNSNDFLFYFAKMLYQMSEFSLIELNRKINRKNFEFLKILGLSLAEKEIEVVPSCGKNNISLISNEIRQLISGYDNQNFKKRLENIEDHLTIGVVFLNEIFLQYWKIENQNFNTLLEWLNQNRELLNKTIGEQYRLFLIQLTNNFSRGLFALNTELSQEKVNLILLRCYVYLVTLCTRVQNNGFSRIIYSSNGNSPKNIIQDINSLYFPADPPSSRVREYRLKLIDFDSIKETKAYKCSDTCDFIYFIGNCGKPMAIGKCPYDNASIGGKDHILIKRVGHIEVSFDQAQVLLKSWIEKYESQFNPGCHVDQLRDIQDDKYESCLKPISFNFLNGITKSLLLLLFETRTISENELQQTIKFTDCFQNDQKLELKNLLIAQTEKYFLKVVQILKTLDCSLPYAWIYSVINEVSILNSNFLNNKERILFQQKFESQIINLKLNDIHETCRRYNASLNKHNSKGVDLLNETKTDDSYKLFKHFRIKTEPSLESLRAVFYNKFSNEMIESDYFLIHIFLENMEMIKELANLFPILRFVNHLLDRFKYQVSRDQAREIPIKKILDDEGSETEELFKSFLTAWNNLSIDFLQYQCHQLEKIKLSRDSPLIYFLIDNKENGGGMYMAAVITYLSEHHNNILKDIFLKIKQINESKFSFLDENNYPAEFILEANILSKNPITESDLNNYSSNDFKYGSGREIIYDFDKLQMTLFTEIIQKRLIDSEKLKFIRYQFELLTSNSDDCSLIQKTREEIKQNFLDGLKERKIKGFINNLKETALKEIYLSLGFILLHLSNKKANEAKTLGNFAKILSESSKKISTFITDEKAFLYDVPICYFIHCFELIETAYFPYFCTKLINIEFKSKHQVDMIKTVAFDIKQDPTNYASLECLKFAVLRFIIRHSIDVLNVNQFLGDYIECQDYWPETINDILIENIKNKLNMDGILISSCFELYNHLEDIVI